MKIKVNKILRLYNPIESCAWPVNGKSLKREVNRCIKHKIVLDKAVPKTFATNVQLHAQRIAFFVLNGWSTKILVDVGLTDGDQACSWGVINGNHRLYAAKLRKDRWIKAHVSGSLDLIKKLK